MRNENGLWPVTTEFEDSKEQQWKGVLYGLHTFFKRVFTILPSRDSSVGIVLRYGLDDRGSRVRLLARAGNFSLHHHFQNGSGAHPASYPMDNRDSFFVCKAAGA
jgi:hypothetical protein